MTPISEATDPTSIMPWRQAQSMEKKNQKIHTVQPSSILMPHEIWQFPPASLVSCPVALIKGMLLSLDSRPAPVSFPRVRSGYKHLSWPRISRYTFMKIKKYNIGLCCQCVLFPKCLLSFSFIGTFSPHLPRGHVRISEKGVWRLNVSLILNRHFCF